MNDGNENQIDNNDIGSGDNLDKLMQRELDQALADIDVESLADIEQPAEESSGQSVSKGKVIAIHDQDIFVEMGGKSQGLLPASQFQDQPVPVVGDIVEFVVQGYDHQDGLTLLARKGAVQIAAWQTLRTGQIVEGRVTGHNKGGLELDINKIKAFMPISQIDLDRVDDLAVYVNQRLRCEVIEINRSKKKVVLSRRELLKVEQQEAAEKTYESLKEGQTVTGTVRSIMPYGAFVDIGGVDGLLHISDMSHARIDKAESVVKQGQQIEVMVLKLDRENNKLSLGLKQIMPDPWDDAQEKWPEGQLVSGRITNLAKFGCFMELEPGVEGLIPISEMSFERRINDPKELVSPGDVIKVRVMKVDVDQKRISLSIKRVGDDPWIGASVRWPAESIVQGTVKQLAQFGAFVELAPGVEGLVHISQISETPVHNVGQVLEQGQTVQVKVISVDEESHRIALSIKQLTSSPDYTGPDTPAGQSPPQRKRPKRTKPLRGGLDL